MKVLKKSDVGRKIVGERIDVASDKNVSCRRQMTVEEEEAAKALDACVAKSRKK